MRFSQKMALMVSTSILGVLIVSGLSMYGLSKLGKSLADLVEFDFPVAEKMADVESLHLEQSVVIERAVVKFLRQGSDNSDFASGVRRFRLLDEQISGHLVQASELFSAVTQGGAQGVASGRIYQLMESIEVNHGRYSALAGELMNVLQRPVDENSQGLDRLRAELLLAENELSEQLATVKELLSTRVGRQGAGLERMEEGLLQSVIWVALLAVISSCLICAVVFKGVAIQLGGDPDELVCMTRSIADGKLHGTDAHNRTGVYASVCLMRERLSEIIGEAAEISETVRTGAGELSVGNMGLSDRTEQQAANLEETAASAEQIAMNVRSNAKNAKAASKLANNATVQAEVGGKTAVAAVEAMEGISDSSKQISAITGVIDEIAFQTNLLALNAAVEAARAGEQGRGFAVVASEVRQLAGRSASAAKEIKELIEATVAQIKGGTELVKNTGVELLEIVSSVNELTDVVSQITLASEKQSVDVDQINHALTQLDSSTQQNSALVEEAAATSGSLSQLASQLNQKVGYFTIT